jgi:hypothetical protein
MNRGRRMARSTLGLAAVLVVAFASLALAAEITRGEYKEQVEPICQANTKANEKILSGVRQEVKQGKLKQAATKFQKAATALKATHRELVAVPQPTADEARLGKWLGYVETEASLFESAAKALKAGNKNKAESYVVKLTHNATLANSTVLSFGFHYCKLQPSKFT